MEEEDEMDAGPSTRLPDGTRHDVEKEITADLSQTKEATVIISHEDSALASSMAAKVTTVPYEEFKAQNKLSKSPSIVSDIMEQTEDEDVSLIEEEPPRKGVKKSYTKLKNKKTKVEPIDWTEKVIKKLCKQWEKQPLLYDQEHENYAKITQRRPIWQKLSKTMSIPSEYIFDLFSLLHGKISRPSNSTEKL